MPQRTSKNQVPNRSNRMNQNSTNLTTRDGPGPAETDRRTPGSRQPGPREEQPSLVFGPLAWLKLQFLCHAGDTEVGGFAVSAAGDPLYVEDLATVRQLAAAASVEFDDAAVADHFDGCVDAGLAPDRFARIWCHTHPGDSPEPSVTDEQTFARAFGACDWAVMFVLSRTGRTYARLAFAAGPGGSVLLPVAVDWAAWPRVAREPPEAMAAQFMGWAAEFERNVHPVTTYPRLAAGDDWWGPDDLYERQVLDQRAEDEFARLLGAGEGVPG